MTEGEKLAHEAMEDGAISLAEQEFINYCEANGFDYAEDDMKEEDRESFMKIKKRFMRAVNEKRLVMDGKKLVYTVSAESPSAAGQELTIRRPIGKDFIAMDGFKETQQMQKLNAFCASFAGVEKSFVARLDIADRQFLEDIATLFLTA
jgi:tRNA(Ile)-lysidine synthase TilS/MesJ